jgi:hypothetical protein
MSDNGKGADEQLAQWMKEAGRRAPRAAPAAASDDTFNSPASLLHYLEDLAGRPLRSRTELRAFLSEVAGSQSVGFHVAERRRMVRELTLLALLAVSYLHYYYWEVQLEIAALSGVRTFAPAPPPEQRKA